MLDLIHLLRFSREYRAKLEHEKPSPRELLLEELRLIGAALLVIGVLVGMVVAAIKYWP